METTDFKTSQEFDLLSGVTFAIADQDADKPALTGFFFTQDGWGLTARHGRGYRDNDRVVLDYAGRTIEATVRRICHEHDVAAIHAPHAEVHGYLQLSVTWGRGEQVLVLGFQRQNLTQGVPIVQRIDEHQPLRQVEFGDGTSRLCLVLEPVKSGHLVRPGSSGGAVLRLNPERREIIGMIVGVDQDVKKGRMDHKGNITLEVEVAPWAYAIPFKDLFLDWQPFRLLLEYPNIKTMAEAVRRVEAQNSPEPPSMQIEGQVEDVWLPVPPDSPRIEMEASLVSNRQFREFVEHWRNGYWKKDGGCLADKKVDSTYLDHWKRNHGSWDQIADLPVVNVSFHATGAFTEWRATQIQKPVRLSTQQELEIAARCARESDNWWEEDIHAGRLNIARMAEGPTHLGRSIANPWGIRDALGNVYKLCLPTDETRETVSAWGGSFHTPRAGLFDPIKLRPDECRPDVGFRCIAELT